MRKTTLIAGGIFAALIILYLFNRLTSKSSTVNLFTEVKKGDFEISIISSGELMAERSVDIKGPEFAQGRDIRSVHIKIQDLVPEGTMVNKGDFIATLDRTEFNNDLKDQLEDLTARKLRLELKLLDTAIVLNDLRDQIRNQTFNVTEAEITFRNSKYESPTVIRSAEIDLDKSQRILDQLNRSYKKVLAQNRTDIYNQTTRINRVARRVKDLEEVLAGFTVTAPASGMVIYKRERRGGKRKIGSTISPMDRVVATLPDLTSLVSRTFVNEIEVSKVMPGQKVKISVDAFPAKAYNGVISSVANIGEKLPNTSDKVFEVQVRLNEADQNLRPSMTTGNKIIIKSFSEAVYIPIECVQAGIDSIPYVYKKDKTKQVVLLGESNEKFVVIEKGLEPGSMIYIANPEKPEKFKLTGLEIIPEIKAREKIRKAENRTYRLKPSGVL